MMEISRNTFQRGIESDNAFTKVLGVVSQFYGLEAYGIH